MDSSPISLKSQSLIRVTVSALGLLILIPSLGVAYLFWEEIRGKWAPLCFLLLISSLGFFLVWRMICAITNIAKGLDQIARGEARAIDLEQGPGQLREMTEIINALNKLTTDFQENAKQLERFIQQFATLTELTEITAKIPDIRELLLLVLRRAMANTYARKGTILLLREEGLGLEIVATEGWTPVDDQPIELKRTVAASVLETGEPLLVEDLRTNPALGTQHDPNRYTNPSFLIMPLKTKTSVVGAMCLSEKGGSVRFSAQDQQFLTVLLGQIGYAVENARLLKQARDAAGELREVVDRQETQIKDAHQQVLRSERLSSLGQLIAGVAHELNNPLTSVVGYTSLLLEDLDMPKAMLIRTVETVQQEAIRASRIVENLLTFARSRRAEKRLTNLNDLVSKVVALRVYDIETHSVEMKIDLDPHLPETLVDSDQIQQVVLNLINNSVQAMTESAKRRLTIATQRENDVVLVRVEDTGRGVPQAIGERIFEPFFTTREGSGGTGLGLNISSGIIKEHGGEIAMESVEGVGTRMTIRLPVTGVEESNCSGDEPLSSGPVFPKIDNKVAVVVDDEEPIADLVARILRSVGFHVVVFTQSRQALARLLDGPVDLVVSDLRMPEISGQAIFEEVLKSRPEIAGNFVFVTGDVADPEVHRFADKHCLPLVPKPFCKRRILEVVHEALFACPEVSPD